MKSFAKICLPLLATALLAGCGGGGGGDGHGATTPAVSGRIDMVAGTLTLPINPTASTPTPGGPFTTEVDITLKGRDGNIISTVDTVNVSINPVSVATFSTLDDPSTDDVNEITQRWGQAPVKVVAGKATVFVTSYTSSGQAVLTVTAPAVGDLNFKSASLTFTVSGAGNTPAVVSLVGTAGNAYLTTTGGRSQVPLTATVQNAGGEVLPDSGANNVEFKVLGDANNGSVKSGSASGQSVLVKTVHGVANATFIAGTTQGPITIQATADGADNDVDNGISEPVSDTFDVVVSDGKLYSLEITSPVFASKLPGITINSLPVADGVEPANDGSVPANPDATLSLTVSALATDRQGNPVLPGTAIRFGSVDAPVYDFDDTGAFMDCDGHSYRRANTFKMAGCDGNPKEGGSLFTAPDGDFTLNMGGLPEDAAGPGDALVVFGKAVDGNSNLESAVSISAVNSATSLSVTPNFNLNATTGSSVDFGNVLPYLVGRAQHGNIGASATTNDAGVASVKLNYTVNTVGQAVAVWAQGSGADRVTDALTMTYPGVAPAYLTAMPNPIPGNVSTQVNVCLSDAIGIPLRGFPIAFQMQLGGGSGSIDGEGMSGVLDHLTGADGCAVANVETSGLPAAATGSNSGSIVFSSAGATATVDLLVQVGFLSASGQLCGTDGDDTATPPVPPKPASIVITAYSTVGGKLSGVPISVSCDGGVSITPTSATTNAAGQALFRATAADATQGTCTFSTDGGRSVTVTVQGSGGGFSPVCP
ncbi:MAG TPA: hypothetical protein VFN09_01465 [Rhodanobacteraceae bacterium]|nr:hypothetical protein [Rhodanobacteraceae bacterium]